MQHPRMVPSKVMVFGMGLRSEGEITGIAVKFGDRHQVLLQ